MTRRRTVDLGHWVAALLVGLGLAGAAAGQDEGLSGQTIARLVSAGRGIVSLGGDPCSVTGSTAIRDEQGNAVALTELAPEGSPARFQAHRGANGCVLDVLELMEKLPD